MDQNTGKVLVVDTEPSAAVAAAVQAAGELPVLAVTSTGTTADQAASTEVAPPPKKNCRHCHGRGYVGKNANTGELVPCYCVEKPTEKKTRLWSLYLQEKFGRK